MRSKVLGALGAMGVVLAAGAQGTASPRLTTAAAVDGPVLYDNGSMSPLMRGIDGAPGYRLPTDSIVGGPLPAEFSEDGTRLAHVDGCHAECTKNAIRILDAGSSRARVAAAFDDSITSLAWSPDGASIAVLMIGDEPASTTIAVVDLATREQSTVVSSSPDFQVEWERGLAWGADDRLAFIGSVQDQHGFSGPGHRNQVWVVAADGGSPAPYLAPSTVDRQYRAPSWSPDGTRLAAFVEHHNPDGDSDPTDTTRALAVMTEGAEGPESLVALPQPWSCDDSGCATVESLAGHWAEWSVEGTRVLFAHDPRPLDGMSQPEVALVTVGNGAVSPVPMPDGTVPIDWQPCPTGTCADFRLALPSAPLDVTARPGPDGGRRTINVRWKDPARGAPFVRFYVQFVNVTTGERRTRWMDAEEEPEPFYFDAGRWKFRVQASNERGRGAWSPFTDAVRPR